MSEQTSVRANFWNESTGHCDCCGNQSKTIWGDLSDVSGTLAVYFVQWTVDKPEHRPNIDIVLGPWGEGTAADDRVLVSLMYQPRYGGGSFMVCSGKGRRADDRALCARSLERSDVIGTPLAGTVFSLLDALWLAEPRIEEIRRLDGLVRADG